MGYRLASPWLPCFVLQADLAFPQSGHRPRFCMRPRAQQHQCRKTRMPKGVWEPQPCQEGLWCRLGSALGWEVDTDSEDPAVRSPPKEFPAVDLAGRDLSCSGSGRQFLLTGSPQSTLQAELGLTAAADTVSGFANACFMNLGEGASPRSPMKVRHLQVAEGLCL